MNRNIVEIPVYVVVDIDRVRTQIVTPVGLGHRRFDNIEVMAVFTSRDDAYRYVEHYTGTDKEMMVYTSVLNPQIHGRYPFQESTLRLDRHPHPQLGPIPPRPFGDTYIPDEPM